MNRNRKKVVAASVAVGMTMVMGVSPVLAADTDISKEETVYVNAAADGTPEDITVSDWLKNSASAGDLSDESDLKDIKNVKGDETFEQDGSNLTWNTEDKDIYYQGTTNKDLPVSMEIKYYLDGVQVSPSDLGGKSGHLKIEVNYTNNVKNKTKVGKKTTDVYAPFVMATAMILPTDNFTNVTIDNGKVLSDGQRNIAIGVGMPGLADSLDLKSIDEDIDLDIPEGFTMEADVTDFSMSSTFTFALTDLLNSLDLDDVDGLDDLKDSMDDLTDAATKLVDGSKELSDGASTLDEKYQEFDSGIGTLSSGVSTLSSGASTLSSGVSSYTSGADTLAGGVKQYVAGSNNLTSGVKTYVDGVSTLQKGIKSFQTALKPFGTGLSDAADGTDQLNTKVAGLVKTIKEKRSELINQIESLYHFAESTEQYATQTGALAQGVVSYVDNVKKLQPAAHALYQMLQAQAGASGGNTSGSGTPSTAGTQQIEAGLATAQAAADSVSAVAGTSAADQLNAAASAVSAAAGTGDALQGDAGTISAGLDSASSAIDILNSIDTSSMDEATAAAVNSALQSAIGAISGGVATAQGGVANLEAHAGQVSGLSEQAAAVQAAAGEVSTQSAQAAAVGDAAAQLQSGLSQIESGLATLSDETNTETSTTATGTTPSALDLAKTLDESLTAMANTEGENNDVATMYNGAASLVKGKLADKLATAAKTIYAGVIPGLQTQLNTYLGEDCENLDTLASKVSELNTGLQSLKKAYNGDITKAIKSMLSGATKLTKNNKTIKNGATQLETSGKTLTSGASQLSANSGTLTSGAAQLASGAQQLVSGTATLSSGSTQVKDGIKSLSDGAKELADGTKKFDDEGIKKLSDLVEDDLQDLMDRFDAIRSDDNAYTSFSGKSTGMDGNVKFVIETAAIDNDSDK